MSLAVGESIDSSKSITVVASAGINLAGNNTIGSASKTVDLETAWGSVSIVGQSNVVYGSLTAGSGSISVAGANVSGNVAAQSGSVTISNSTVGGTITATSGAITLTSVALTGSIASSGNVTLNGPSTVTGNITISGSLTITGGSVSGNVSANNGVTMTGGTVFGSSVTSTNGPVSLNGGSVAGNVSGHNGVTTTNGTVVVGGVNASNGPISLAGGSVGSVFSGCCSLTTNNTDIKGSVSAKIGSASDTVKITGGTISGAISTSGGNGIFITNATVTSGSITTTNVQITISGSHIGSQSSPVNVTNNGNQSITITGNSEVYGNATTGGTLTIDPGSVVYGECKFSSLIGQCTPFVSGPDHIRVFFNNNTSALTCAPRVLDAIACTNSNCEARYASPVSVTLSPGGAAATIPAGGSGTPSVARTSEGDATITLAASNPAVSALRCYVGSVASPGNVVACSLTFSKSGFFVSVPDHASCTTQTLTITAAKADDKGKTCVPAFDNGASRNVKLRFTYANPTKGASPAVVPTVGSANPPTTKLKTTADVNLAMTFTNGAATTNLLYNDAGSLTVSASYTGSAATGDAGLSMATVAASAFVVAPASFAISGIPAAPLTAGSPFDVTVTAKNSCNDTTANFGSEATPATALLTSSNPQPALGNATPISQTLTGFSKGAASTTLTWNEVGTVDITATTSKYLASNLNVVGTQAGVGRFKPAYFDTIVSHGCSGVFTYAGLTTPAIAGQQFTVEVKAKRTGGDLTDATNTANYAGVTWAKAVTLSDAKGGAGTLTNNSFAAADFSAGKAKRTDVSYALATKLTAPYTLAIRAMDADSPAVSSSGHSEGSTQMRSGRLRLQSGQGSGQVPYVVKSEAQYWDGVYWRTNAQDSCTSYATANVKVTGSTGTTVSAASGVSNGYGSLTLSKPTNLGLATLCLDSGTLANDGCATNPASPASIGYLRGNWKTSTSYDQDPSATVLFGGANADSRGNWGFLYRRENF